MVALSHPTLRPERNSREVRRYSQHFIDAMHKAQQEAKARTWAHQRAAQAVAAGVDPFTGAPASAEGTQEWVL